MEEEIFVANQEDKNNAGMVGSLLEMMSIAEEEKDFDRLKKLIATFDDIGTKYCADDVDYYRGVLKKKGWGINMISLLSPLFTERFKIL